jgi:predicted MPP superfamily phosphohydrolase
MWQYTTRGLGNTSVPLRINCPPEISQLVLVSA